MSDPLVVDTTAATTTPTQSGQTTFAQAKSDVAVYFGMDKDPEKLLLAGRVIGEVIDDLNRKKLWQFMLITAADITTVSGTSSYAVPSDLWRIYNTRKSDGIDFALTGLRESSLDLLFQSQNAITGYPYARSSFNLYRDGSIKLFPIPDGAYTIKLRYFSLIPKPTSDGAVLDMPTPFQNVPMYGARARFGALVGSQMTSYWEGKFTEAYNEMNAMDENDGEEDLRILNIEELASRWSFTNPNSRSRLLDFY